MFNRAVIAITKKDIKNITSNVQVWLPLLIVPLIMVIIYPAILILVARYADLSSLQGIDFKKKHLSNLPAGDLKTTLYSFSTLQQQLVYLVVNYLFIPFFLIVPAMSASVIAANSFVSEKEGRTLESLLFAPVDIQSLFVGKTLSALLPTIALTLISFVAYGIIVDALAYPMFGKFIFPTTNWWVLLLWVIPMISATCILANVLISARVKTFQAANQLSGLIILPILLLLAGQFTGLLLLSSWVLLIIGGVLLLFNLFFLRKATRLNSRNRLFESQIH
jgi:ABC-type Na+ efflux pump permease subunit